MTEQSQSNAPVDTDETVLGAEQAETPEVETPEADENGNETEEREFSNVTPYAAAEVANRLLGVKEGEKERTSQTFYSYARNHSIKSNYDQWLADGSKKSGYKVELDGVDFKRWLDDSAAGKIRGRSRNDYDRLADEFALDAE